MQLSLRAFLVALALSPAACAAASAEAEPTERSEDAVVGNWKNGCGDLGITAPSPGIRPEELPANVRAWWTANGGTRIIGGLLHYGVYPTLDSDGNALDLDDRRADQTGRLPALYRTYVFERYVLQQKPFEYQDGLQGMLLGSIRRPRSGVAAVTSDADDRAVGFGQVSGSCAGERWNGAPLAQPVDGAFCNYFQSAGRVPVVGTPVTPRFYELVEGKSKLVQYFERERLEWAPRSQTTGGDGCDYRLQLGRLGAELLASGVLQAKKPGGVCCKVVCGGCPPERQGSEGKTVVGNVDYDWCRRQGISDHECDNRRLKELSLACEKAGCLENSGSCSSHHCD